MLKAVCAKSGRSCEAAYAAVSVRCEACCTLSAVISSFSSCGQSEEAASTGISHVKLQVH